MLTSTVHSIAVALNALTGQAVAPVRGSLAAAAARSCCLEVFLVACSFCTSCCQSHGGGLPDECRVRDHRPLPSRYDALAQRIGATITVNKSLAVVLGVGPLLCINLLYTLYFYSANALTGMRGSRSCRS